MKVTLGRQYVRSQNERFRLKTITSGEAEAVSMCIRGIQEAGVPLLG